MPEVATEPLHRTSEKKSQPARVRQTDPADLHALRRIVGENAHLQAEQYRVFATGRRDFRNSLTAQESGVGNS